MKYQLNVLIEVLKKSLKFIIFFFAMISIEMTIILNKGYSKDELFSSFISFISMPTVKNITIIDWLVVLYYVTLIIYITVSYFIYEKNHSYENTILRFSYKSYFVSKLFIIITFLIVFNLLYIIFTSLLLLKSIRDFSSFYINSLYFIVIAMNIFIITNKNIYNKKAYYINLILFIICILMFNVKYALFYLICLIFFCYNYSNLKPHYCNKKQNTTK